MEAMRAAVIAELEESARIKKSMVSDPDTIIGAARIAIKALKAGKKLLLIGNGGSAADAQHIATELVGRFRKERKAINAIALTTNTSLLTALANDYGYDTVFSRQLEATGESGDVLIAISTSGLSANILKAIKTAKAMGMKIIALTGKSGGKLKGTADVIINVPSDNTPRIQEAHITIGHIICYLVEEELSGE